MNLVQTLTDAFGPLGPFIVVGGLGLVLVLIAVPAFLGRREDPLAKLKAERTGKGRALKGGDAKLRVESRADKLQKYAGFLEPQDAKELSAVKLKLLQAGYRGKEAVRTYYFAQLALGLGLLAAGVIYVITANASGQELSTTKTMLFTLVPALIGYMGPKRYVNKRVEKRQEEIVSGFPDALDMMLVCIEAGQSMDQSIIRVAKELEPSYPSLAFEFAAIAHEMKAGKDKVLVLKDMAERCGVMDVTSFVTVLIQSQTFGTSIAEALRVYAAEMRDKRVMRAEEKANTLPTKMTLATMMLTVPPLLIILLGPSINNIAKTLGGH